MRAACGQITRSLVDRIPEAHVKIELLRRENARQCKGTHESVVVATEAEMQRSVNRSVGSSFDPARIARFSRRRHEAVIVNRVRTETAQCDFAHVILGGI